MFKTLVTALLILLLSAAGAGADPISGAIAVIGSLLSTSGLVKLAITVAINVGMGLIEQAKARREARKNQRPSGVTLSIQMGDAQPRSYLIGTRATAGRRIYFGTWGQAGKTPNAYATDVIELSCLPNNAGPQGLDAVWIGDKKVTVLWDQPHPDGRGYPIEGYQQGGGDWLWIKFLDGSQTAADPFLVATFGGHADHPFKTTMIGRGCQVVILTARFNQEFFKSGLPQGLYQPKPMRLYDLRKDSTNGGVGTHRWSDPSTWEASDNLGVMMYNISRGIYYGGRWVHGGRNFAQHRLPASSWMAALNEADRLISGRKQFRGGLEVFVDQDPLDVIEDLRIGCAGRLAEVGGILKPLIGAPAAAVYSFTDAQIIVTSEQDFEPFPSVSSTHNTITAVYPEPEQKWADKDAPERSSATLLARDDGERLPVPVRFEAVSIVDQVQCLMATMIEEEQRWRIHELVLPPDAAPLEPNDVVAWSSDRNAYSNKKFLVDRAICLPGLLQQVRLKELDPSDYDPPAIIYPPVVGPIGPLDPPAQPAYGFAVTPAVLVDGDGNQRRPSIKVSCASDQDDVVRVWIQVRVKATGQVVYDNDSTPYAAPFEWILNGAFLPNTIYQVRLRFIPYTKRETTWSDWVDVTTPNILLATLDFLNESITAEKIANAAVTASKIMNEAVTALKLADQAVSTAKLQVAAVTSAILADQAVLSTKLADAAVTAQKLADGAVSATKFAAGIEPVTIVTGGSLPTTKSTETIFFQNQLHQWNGTAYVPIEAEIGPGSITATQIADGAISTPKLAANVVTSDKLASNSVIAGKIAAGAVSADQIAANAVIAEKIAAGAVTAEKLAIGLGNNLLGNTELFGGYVGWETWNQAGVANRQITLRPEIDTWALKSQPYTWSFEQIDANATAGVLQSAHARYIPVIAGKRYQLFAFLGTHRCQGYVGCSFLDHTGAYITEFNSATINNNGGGGKIITNYGKVGIFVTAPANAAVAVFYMRKLPTQSGSDSYMFAVRPYFGEAGPNQSAFSEWTPGGVTYIGSDYLLTGSVTASKIAALAVTAEKIAALAITADKIAAGAITADKIAAASITGDKIAANTIGAVNIAAQAIIASKLIITDFSNMADNGFDVGDFSSWNWGGSPIQYYKEGAGSPVSTAYVAATQSDWIAVSKRSACKEGDAFMLEAWVYNSDLTSSAISIYAAGDDGNGVWKTFSIAASTTLKGQWVKLQGRAVIPPGYGVQRVAFLVAKGTAGGWGYFSKPVMRRATNAEMIVDGSITADKLNVNNLSAVSANFGDAYHTGYSRSINGKVVIDWNNGNISISD